MNYKVGDRVRIKSIDWYNEHPKEQKINMKQIWKGKLKLRIKKECPYYGTDYRLLEKVLFYKWGWSISLWTIHPDDCIGKNSVHILINEK